MSGLDGLDDVDVPESLEPESDEPESFEPDPPSLVAAPDSEDPAAEPDVPDELRLSVL